MDGKGTQGALIFIDYWKMTDSGKEGAIISSCAFSHEALVKVYRTQKNHK